MLERRNLYSQLALSMMGVDEEKRGGEPDAPLLLLFLVFVRVLDATVME